MYNVTFSDGTLQNQLTMHKRLSYEHKFLLETLPVRISHYTLVITSSMYKKKMRDIHKMGNDFNKNH
jgi:hypothetical protein